ncbi:MAG: hypothetical protein AAF376_19360 [Pseudomonadota bacterium]
MSQFSPQMPMGFALCIGLLSGIVSTFLLEPVLSFDWSSLLVRTYGDRISLQLSLALSAGLPFGLIGAAYLWWRKSIGWPMGLIFVALSMVGMFAAVEVAIQVFVMNDDPNDLTLVPSYLAASLVGAGIVMGGSVLIARLKNWRFMMLHGLLWPTVASLLVAVAIVASQAENLFDPPWSVLLFCGWQAAFLAVLSRAEPRVAA